MIETRLREYYKYSITMYFVIDCSVLVAGLAALSGVLCTLDKEMEID